MSAMSGCYRRTGYISKTCWLLTFALEISANVYISPSTSNGSAVVLESVFFAVFAPTTYCIQDRVTDE